MNTWFLVGLAASIPLSVLANLLTPLCQRWISTSSTKRRLARDYDQANDAEGCAFMSTNPVAYSIWAIRKATSVVIAVIGYVACFLAFAIYGRDGATAGSRAVTLAAFLGTVVLGYLALTQTRRMHAMNKAIAEASDWPEGFRVWFTLNNKDMRNWISQKSAEAAAESAPQSD